MDRNAKARLRLAYDADAARRNAKDPEAWRFAAVDDFVDRMRHAGLHTVLDVGCGTGHMAARMADGGMDVTGVDLSPANVICTQARGVAAVVGDFSSLPFGDGIYDAALAFNSLLHVPKVELAAVLAEIRRVLAAGGLFKMIVWGGIEHEGPHDKDWLDPPRFFSFFSDAAFATLPTPGFETIATEFLHDEAEADGLHPQAKLLRAT